MINIRIEFTFSDITATVLCLFVFHCCISPPHLFWLLISWRQWSAYYFGLFRRGETSASWSRSCARPRRECLGHAPQPQTRARNAAGTTGHTAEKVLACSWSNRHPTQWPKSKCRRSTKSLMNRNFLWAHKQKWKTKQERLNRTFMKTFFRVFSCTVTYYMCCRIWGFGSINPLYLPLRLLNVVHHHHLWVDHARLLIYKRANIMILGNLFYIAQYAILLFLGVMGCFFFFAF